ncbi:hypothetical protein N802_12600 [Knoellia sinensis KCTC 19936]|uniref:Uncharacterized protein n=1 Tax=Knoellia sinensis KCTC 19936 TaxID=1385520 RepID=A0A0A0JDT3_9MICO|nr:hypothetical protein [Knoellia sinensis]KGN34212.1 hypothetical protein N802_12600 [Knoellia sinensis KCTC 19936]
MTGRKWPAYVMAVLSLGYALGKATYAVQGKLGFPTGPEVPAEEYLSYQRDLMNVSVAQWLGCATGLLGAAIAWATVTPAGRRVPRPLMLLALVGMLVGVGAGAGVLVIDGFVGLGVGWQWFHGIAGVVVLAVMGLMTRSWFTRHNEAHE